MSNQSRKHRGYAAQRIAAEYVRDLWPLAEPTGAGRPGKDILATPGASVEVKAQANLAIPAFVKQVKNNTNEEEVSYLFLRLNGQGEKSIGQWPVVMLMDDWKQLMKEAGRGVPSVSDREDS